MSDRNRPARGCQSATRCRALFTILAVCACSAPAQTKQAPFRVLAIAERGGLHRPFVDAAKAWLDREGKSDFSVDYIENTDTIDEALLARYSPFLRLNYPPYAGPPLPAPASRP